MKFLLFYTDPGSGIMLLQLLLATVAGVFYYFRSFFFRLFGRWYEWPTDKNTPRSAPPETE